MTKIAPLQAPCRGILSARTIFVPQRKKLDHTLFPQTCCKSFENLLFNCLCELFLKQSHSDLLTHSSVPSWPTLWSSSKPLAR